MDHTIPLKNEEKLCPKRSTAQAVVVPVDNRLTRPGELNVGIQSLDLMMPCVRDKCEWWRIDIGQDGGCVIHLLQELKDLIVRPVGV